MASDDLDAWARCFRMNLGSLKCDGGVELHYEPAASWFGQAGFKWTSQARYNHAPGVSLKEIGDNSFSLYASKVSDLLGTPFRLCAVRHPIDVFPYDHLVPHKKGSKWHGYTNKRSYGYFCLMFRT